MPFSDFMWIQGQAASTLLSCQSLGHSEQMLAQPAGHGDLETISKGVFFGSVGTQLSPPGNGDPAQRGISEQAI